MLTGRNPQHGPDLAQASPCSGAACPSLDCGEGHNSPQLLPCIFWKLGLVPLFSRRDVSIFVFQAALALFPGPLECPRGAGWVLSVSPPAQLGAVGADSAQYVSTSAPFQPNSW